MLSLILKYIQYLYLSPNYQISPCTEEHMAQREKKSARGLSDPHAGDRIHPEH